jgi:hypothetical protein
MQKKGSLIQRMQQAMKKKFDVQMFKK